MVIFELFLRWGLFAFAGLVFLLIVVAFLWKHKLHHVKETFLLIAISSIIFRVIYAIVETLGQYYTWSTDTFSSLFLPPHLSWDYFIQYSFVRFWWEPVTIVAVSFLFYAFLRFLQKKNKRFFVEGEPELGFALSIIVGWPGFILFIPFIFVSASIVQIFRVRFARRKYITLGAPILLAALAILIFGSDIINALSLEVFNL